MRCACWMKFESVEACAKKYWLHSILYAVQIRVAAFDKNHELLFFIDPQLRFGRCRGQTFWIETGYRDICHICAFL